MGGVVWSRVRWGGRQNRRVGWGKDTHTSLVMTVLLLNVLSASWAASGSTRDLIRVQQQQQQRVQKQLCVQQ